MNNNLITIIINASNNCSKVQIDDNGVIIEPIIATQPVPGQSYEVNSLNESYLATDPIPEESYADGLFDQRYTRSSPIPNQSYVPLINPTIDKNFGSMYLFKFMDCNHDGLNKNCRSSIAQIPESIVEQYVDKTVEQSDLSIAPVPGQNLIPLVDLTDHPVIGASYVFRVVRCKSRTRDGCKNVIISIPQKVAESYVIKNNFSDSSSNTARNTPNTPECNQINGAGCFPKAQIKCVQDCHDASPIQTQDCRIIDGVNACFSSTILPCVTRCFSKTETRNQTPRRRRQ